MKILRALARAAIVATELRSGWQNVGRAPIPLRARRQLAAVPVPAEADVVAAVSEIEFAIAKAA